MSDRINDDLSLIEEPDRINFVTSAGRKVPTKKFSPLLLEKIRNSVDFPAVPMYEITTASGAVEYHEHTEDTLETEEDIKAWGEYKERESEANSEVIRRMLNLVLLKGVDVELPKDNGWVEEQELIGIEVPKDNPAKLKLHYIETEVLSSTDDLGGLMTFVMERIGIRREVIEEAEKSFQDNVPEQTSERTGEAVEVGRDGRRDGGRNYQVVQSRLEL